MFPYKWTPHILLHYAPSANISSFHFTISKSSAFVSSTNLAKTHSELHGFMWQSEHNPFILILFSSSWPLSLVPLPPTPCTLIMYGKLLCRTSSNVFWNPKALHQLVPFYWTHYSASKNYGKFVKLNFSFIKLRWLCLIVPLLFS